MLWFYAIVLFFIIMGQAMTVAVLAVSVDYGDSIFADMWRELEPETIDDIENTYECCSFNGNSMDTWIEDATRYQICTIEKDYDESCWRKFESEVDNDYSFLIVLTALNLLVQIMGYFTVMTAIFCYKKKS